MKTDLYTKLVLTVIAVCLIGQLFRDVPVVTTARAESRKELIQSVSVVGWSAGTLSVSGNVGVYNPQNARGVTVPLAVQQTQPKEVRLGRAGVYTSMALATTSPTPANSVKK